MPTTDLYRLASVSSWVALVALVLSGVALALFFGGAGEFWGPVNDALTVVTAVALIPVVVTVAVLVAGYGAPWPMILGTAAIAGLILIAAGQSLLIIGRLSLDGSYVTGGIGVAPVLVWLVLVAVLGLRGSGLPTTVGWLAAVVLLAIVIVSVLAVITRGPALWIAGVGLLIALAAWLAGLATTFGERAAA